MKKLLLLLIIAFAIFVGVYRQRLFMRDPFATLTRDGVRQFDAQVYINYSNDVVIENDDPPMYTLVVQHGQHVGTPERLPCIHWMACMTDANVTTLSDTSDALVTEMTGKMVRFEDSKGHEVRVKLR